MDIVGGARSVEVEWSPGMMCGHLIPEDTHPDALVWGVGESSWCDVVPTGTGAQALDVPVLPGCHVAVVSRPLGVELGFASALSAGFSSVAGFLGDLGSALNSLASGALGYFTLREIGDFLVPDIPGREINGNRSQVYGWNGVGSTYVPAGTPIPRLYGELRVGLAVIAQDFRIFETDEGPKSLLRLIGVVAAGRIEAIGEYDEDVGAITNPALMPEGMQIDGNDASNFDDVKCYIRLGSFDQDVIPGFETLRTVYQVGLELTQEPASETPIVDWTLAEVWDMPQGVIADRCTVTIAFPAGLFKLDPSDGKLLNKTATFQVRTTEIDDAGIPIGAPVIHPSASDSFEVRKKVNAAFQQQFEIPLFDGDDFVEPVLGNALDLNRSAREYAYITNTTVEAAAVPGFVDSSEPDEFTIFMVAKIDTAVGSSGKGYLFSWGDWDESTSDPQVEGIVIGYEPLGTSTEPTIFVWHGDSVVTGTRVTAGGEFVFGEAVSIAVSYTKSDAQTGQPRLDLYVNGSLVATDVGDTPIRWISGLGSVGPCFNTTARKVNASSSFFGGAEYDEFVFYKRRLDPVEVSQKHQAGAWQSLEGDAADVFMGLKMDAVNPQGADEVTPVDYGAMADNFPGAAAILERADAGDLVVGVVANAFAFTPDKRARYRIEVQQTSGDSQKTNKQDDAVFDSVTLELDELTNHTGLALVGLEIEASGQLSSARPNVTVVARGLRVPVWDGVDQFNPAFVQGYSRNPAWQLAELLTSRSGLGRFYTLTSLRLLDFKAWADFCDDPVYDQQGRLFATQIERIDNGDGTFSDSARVPTPLPAHWEVGTAMKLRNVVPAAHPFADRELTIEEIVSVDANNSDVRWSAPAVQNLVDDPTDLTAWGTAGTAPVIDETDTPLHIPPFAAFPVAEVVTFKGGGLSLLTKLVPGLAIGVTYALSTYAKVVDGGGDYTFRIDFGSTADLVTLPDDGQWHRLSTFIAANNPSMTMRLGNGSSGQPDRQIAVSGAMAHVGTVLLPYDEAPAGPTSPTNILSKPNQTDDSSVWIPGVAGAATNPPVLTEVDAEQIPGIPGKAEKWTVDESNTHIFQTPDSGSFTPLTAATDYTISFYAKIADGRGTMQGKGVIGGSQQSDKWAVPDDGEWHRVIYTGQGTSASDAGNGVRFTNILGQRQILIGGFHLVQASSAPGYDDGERLAELFATEARIATSFFFGDRNLGAWDAVLLLMRAGRASPARLGEVFGVRFDSPRASCFVFTPANMVPDSVRRSIAGLTRPNSLTGEIQSDRLDFERDTIKRDHPSLEAADVTSASSLRSQIIDMRGITSPTVAIRELDQRLINAFDRRETIKFAGSTDGFNLRPGMVVTVAVPSKRWARGAKVYEESADASILTTDQPFALGSNNLLQWSNNLTRDVWNRTSSGAEVDEPTATENAGAEPDAFGGFDLATRIEYPGTGNNSRVRQSVTSRGVGATYTFIVWLLLESGTDDALEVSIVTSSETIATASPTLTAGWQRVVVTGVQSIAEDEVFFRLKQSDSDASPLSILAARTRAIIGDDDGMEAVGLDSTMSFPKLYATLKSAQTDEVSVVEVKNTSGAFDVGDAIKVDGAFSFVPQAGDLFAIGPASETEYEIVAAALDFNGNVSYSGVIYLDNYQDPDDYETFDVPLAIGAAGQQDQAALIATSPAAIPPQPKSIALFAEAERDPSTGRYTTAVMVSWSFPSGTAFSIDHVRIWMRLEGDTSFENVAHVNAPKTQFRVPAELFAMERGDVVEVVVQPVSATGIRRSVKRGVSSKVKIDGYFPVPPAPASARVTLNGLQAVYEVEEPASGWQGAVVDIVRGGVFVHTRVGRIPTGGGALGPVDDWVQLPTSASGMGNPRLLARTNGPDGARGPFVEVTGDLDLEGWPDVLSEGSWEDGPWSVDGALDAALEEVDPDPAWRGSWKELRFTDAATETEAYWTAAIVDLGRPRRVHVSSALIGQQEHPLVFEDFPPFDAPRGDRWSFEGPLDRADPEYDVVTAELEIAYSESAADPGSNWRPFKPGVFYARSFRLRIKIVRPDDTYNFRVSRGAFAIRPLPPTDADHIDAGRITG